MRIIILGNKAAETIKKHIVSVWDNIEVVTYKSVDLLAQDLDSRSIACDRIIITEEVVPSADVLQNIKDFLEERYMTIQIVVILKSEDKLAACTEVCYDESSSVVFCMGTMKANFVKDLPTKSITDLRKIYSDNVYHVSVMEENVDVTGVQVENDNYEPMDEFDDFDDFSDDLSAGTVLETDTFDTDFENDFADNATTSRFTNSDYNDTVLDDDEFDTEIYSNNEEVQNTMEDFDDLNDFSADDMSNASGNANIIDTNDSAFNLESDFDGDDLPDFPVLSGHTTEDDTEVNASYFADMDIETDVEDSETDFDDFDTYESTDISNTSVVMDDYLPDDTSDDLPDDYNFETVVRSFEGNRQDTVSNNISTGQSANMHTSARTNKSAVVTPVSTPVSTATSVNNTQQKPKGKFFGNRKQNPKTTVNTGVPQASLYSQVGTKYAQTMNGQAMSIIIVTGDRRSGITSTAFQMAAHFATKVPTLYVDYDIVRRGSVFQLSLDDLLRCNPEVQNGLGVLRVGKQVSNIAFKSPNCEFDALVSIPNYALSDESLIQTQTQLLYQREYNAVIIDCPFDHLYLLSDVLSMASTYICINGDLMSCSSTILELDRLNPVSKTETDKKLLRDELELLNKGVNEKNLTTIVRALSTKDVLGLKVRLTEKDISMVSRGQYIITGDNITEQQFLQNMQYLSRIYNLGATSINWTQLRIAGTKNNLIGILQNLI